MDFVRFVLANEEHSEMVFEDTDPTFSRTKEECRLTLATAIEVVRGRGTSEEYLSDFYGEHSEPEEQQAPFSSTLVCDNAHDSRVVDHLGQLKLSLRQQPEFRFFGLALNPTARHITKEVGYTMPQVYCEIYFRSAGHRVRMGAKAEQAHVTYIKRCIQWILMVDYSVMRPHVGGLWHGQVSSREDYRCGHLFADPTHSIIRTR